MDINTTLGIALVLAGLSDIGLVLFFLRRAENGNNSVPPLVIRVIGATGALFLIAGASFLTGFLDFNAIFPSQP